MFKKGSKEKKTQTVLKKGNTKWNIQKDKKMQYMTRIQFITKKNISHYVSVRTNGWNQSLEGSQSTYWK